MSDAPQTDAHPEGHPTESDRRFYTELRSRALDLERRNAQLGATLNALQIENDSNRARLVQVRNSLSWRITRPLRRARRFVSALLRKVIR